MSDEKDELKKLMGEFVGAVNGLLKRHEEAISRLAENLKLEHLNVKEIGAMVNEHTHIFQRLDAAMKERLGIGEAPPDVVN
jgi:arsenate reductase-like glutaredoxin family protein